LSFVIGCCVVRSKSGISFQVDLIYMYAAGSEDFLQPAKPITLSLVVS